jgi:hypothetical protein
MQAAANCEVDFNDALKLLCSMIGGALRQHARVAEINQQFDGSHQHAET